MINLKKINYNKIEVLESRLENPNYLQKIIIKKVYSAWDNKDHYFIYLEKINPDGNYEKQGYLYFYYNEQDKRSEFIGLYINPKYRNQGFASLLISCWIRICIDNELSIIRTIQKQQKPFLIYLLKLYYFELQNKELYKIHSSLIDICKKENDKTKYLYFHNSIQAQQFSKGKIYQEDNYQILDDLPEDLKILDSVILQKRYYLQDKNEAYIKSMRIKEKYQNNN